MRIAISVLRDLSSALLRRPSLNGLAAGGTLLAAALILILHIQNPEFNPITRAMSDYVHGRWGILQSAALIVLGASVLALASAFRPRAIQRRHRLGLLLLAAAGVCLLIAGVFPIDNTPDGTFNTPIGATHATAGFLLSPLAVAAMLALSDALDQTRSALTRALAILTAVAFVILLTVNLVLHWPIGGAGQRVFMALVCAWLLVASTQLSR